MAGYQQVQRLQQIITECEEVSNRQHLNGEDQTYGNLLRWGGALMQLSCYEDADAARERLADAILKLNLAREWEAGHHQNYWLLGSAHALRLEISREAYHLRQLDREQSVHYFAVAKRLDPTNKLYIKSNENGVLAFFKNKRTWGTLGAGALGFCAYKLAFGFFSFLLWAGGY